MEELRLQDAHDEVHRLREEQETLKKLKGKKKKKTPSRLLRDEQRAEQRRAEAEKLVARLEAERVERAGEEEDDDERTNWREVAKDDLEDSDGELCFEDPRQAAWADLPQDLREVPKHEAVEAGPAVSGASCGRAGAEASGGRGDDGRKVGGGNDLGGGLGEGAVQGLRPGRRIVGLGCDWGAVE